MLGLGIVLAALPTARAADTTCPPISSTVNGNLIVPTGQFCETTVTVTGNVQVQPNATLILAPAGSLQSTIEGNLTLGSGANLQFYGTGQTASARIGGNVTADHCYSVSLGSGTELQYPNPVVIVGGNVLIQYCNSVNETDNTEIGGNFTCNSNPDGCSLGISNIKGNVQSNNNGSSVIGLNTVGGNVEVNNNGFAAVGGNTIGGNLQCQGNTSITDGQEVNMVGGHKTGQCANF